MSYEYECAMTGSTQDGGASDDSDELGDLPVGWTRVRITRRAYNPRWVMLQQVKEAMVANTLEGVPPELHVGQRAVVQLQVDAQFHGLESDTPMFLPDIDDVVYLSDSDELVPSINEMREMLGLEVLVLSGDADNDDDDVEDDVDDDDDGDDDDDAVEDDDGAPADTRPPA